MAFVEHRRIDKWEVLLTFVEEGTQLETARRFRTNPTSNRFLDSWNELVEDGYLETEHKYGDYRLTEKGERKVAELQADE